MFEYDCQNVSNYYFKGNVSRMLNKQSQDGIPFDILCSYQCYTENAVPPCVRGKAIFKVK